MMSNQRNTGSFVAGLASGWILARGWQLAKSRVAMVCYLALAMAVGIGIGQVQGSVWPFHVADTVGVDWGSFGIGLVFGVVGLFLLFVGAGVSGVFDD